MKLDYAIDVAKDFAKMVYPIKELKIKDLLLYGSTSRREKNPRDLDLLIIHSNPTIDKFLIKSKDKKINDLQKLSIINGLLGPKINLEKKFKNTEILKLINQNLLNINYLNSKFFKDVEYQNWWNGINKKFHDPNIKKGGRTSESFLKHIFEQGKLWNQKTKEYDLSYNKKYLL